MNCEMNSILDFFDEVLDFTKTFDRFKRVCESLENLDINWKSDYGQNFVSKFAEAKHELVKRCPVHGYEEDEINEDDTDEEMGDSEEESDMDNSEEDVSEEEEESAEDNDGDVSDDMGQCCCESIFLPMEPFYRNKSFKKLVQKEEDDWAESNTKFDTALSNLKNIQPLIENATRNGIENLSSLEVRLTLNLIENFDYYSGKTEEVLENFFKYSYAKLIDPDVSLNEKRKLMSKPHLEKKVLHFLCIMQDWLNPNFDLMRVTKNAANKKQKGSGNSTNSYAKTLHDQVLDSTLNMTKDAMIGNDLADRF